MRKENERQALSVNGQGTFSKIFEKVQVEQNVIVRTFREEALPVESGELGLQVNSRLLHQALKSGYQYAHWITDRITRYRLKEGRDFLRKILKSSGGRRATDYIISVSTALHLAMVEESEIGFILRDYFIEIEKRYRDWIGFMLPRLEMDFDLFGKREGYNYIQLLRACGCSLASGRIHARIRKYRQEFWRNQAKDIYVSEKYGKTIITNAIARKLNTEAKERRLEYENQKALTEGGVL